jgi:hypothetical protein
MPTTTITPSTPPEPAANRHEISGTVIETVRRTDGWWLYRCPEIFPVNARHWRGYFEHERAALADFVEKTRIPRLTPDQLNRIKHHGCHSVINEHEYIRHLDLLTGATVLTTYEIITAG